MINYRQGYFNKKIFLSYSISLQKMIRFLVEYLPEIQNKLYMKLINSYKKKKCHFFTSVSQNSKYLVWYRVFIKRKNKYLDRLFLLFILLIPII
jgi:hypothetical protein